jgi:hypothetical protein
MLQLHNQSAFVPFLNVLPDPDGVDTLQVVAKGTFSIYPRVELAAVQLPALWEDQYWGDPAGSSLRMASDAHLGKAATDVVMVGQARSVRGRVPEMLVALSIAERRKIIRVVGDRIWRDRGAGFTRPEPFESMPLMYERAFGGAQHDKQGQVVATEERNPVGTGFAGRHPAGELTGKRLPNLEDPHLPLARAGDRPPPAGFGFIAAAWLPRRAFAGTYGGNWARTRAPYLPRDFDRRFFNAASADLIFDRFLSGGEPVELSGVSRHGPLRFSLPTERPQAVVWIARQILTPPMQLETVVFEPDDDRLSLTWRATLSCDKAALKLRQVTITTIEKP